MDKTLENYLERVENYLRPMAVSERIDIVREIKSEMLDYIFSLGIPYMQNIGIVFEGILELNPITEFLVALPISALLFLGGRGAWKLLLYYCQSVGRTKRKLSI